MNTNNKGIVLLAFGREFAKLTAATLRYSRQFTDLPVRILTNMPDCVHLYNGIKNISFEIIPILFTNNRAIKVSLINHTPYEKTLFMDSDAVLQRHGIESLFSYLDDFDLACQNFGRIPSKNMSTELQRKTYGKLAALLGEDYPIKLCFDAAILFRKTPKASEFFKLWEEYWNLMGSSRDMPGFSFAVKRCNSSIKVFRRNEIRFCTNREDESYFIQHKGFEKFGEKFGLPNYVDWNPVI